MRVAVLGCALLVVAGPARADVPTLVFPLTAGTLPAPLAGAPDRLTRALAGSIDATVARVPIEDAAGLLECDPEATACLEAVASSMGAGRIVFGTIATSPGATLVVTVTRFDPGPARQQRTFELREDTVDELSAELVRAAAPLFGRSAPRVAEPTRDPAPAPHPPPVDEPPRGAVTPGTWAILGGSVAVTGVGVGFWLSGYGLRSEVEAAPRATREELEALIALEDTGRLRTRLGGVLTAVGGVALAYGVYRVIVDRRRPADRDRLVVTPVPLEGGAALVLTLGVP